MQGVNLPKALPPSTSSIGEPKHPTPEVITNALTALAARTGKYPRTAGLPELRQACADWMRCRYDGLTVNPIQKSRPYSAAAKPCFPFVQTVLNPVSDDLKPIVLSPNPFYQIYEGAAILGGGETVLPTALPPSFKPD